jgi:hypothetical protein
VALDGQPTDPTAAEVIKNDFYVDDLLSGADTAKEAIQLYEDVTSLLKSGGFPGCSSTWKTYVANRVAEIQRLTTNQTWRHVASRDNPVDIISRGTDVR